MKTVSENVIVLALPRYDSEYASTSYSLSMALAGSARIFYIDNPFTVKHFFTSFRSADIKKRLKALLFGKDIYHRPSATPSNFLVVTPRLVLPINWLSQGFIYNWLARFNDRIIYSAIKKVIREHKIEDFIFVNSYNPLYGLYFPKSFNPKFKVYHCVDDISQSPYVAKHGTRLETEYLINSDAVITTSSQLLKLKSSYSPNVYLIPNAANIELFTSSLNTRLPRPKELINFEGDVICYTGNLDSRVDFDLLHLIATSFPKELLLLVGPINSHEPHKKGLVNMSNVLFAGSKALQDLPAYLQHSTCTIIPFKKNKLTESIYPLKINEYLAAGKPVVSTNFSVDIGGFSQYCNVVESHSEFVVAISKEIASNSPEKERSRSDYVKGNNWENRAIQFWEIMNELTANNKQGIGS